MQVHRIMTRLARTGLAFILVMWLLSPFSPLTLIPQIAPVNGAHAANIDDLGKCLDAATTVAAAGSVAAQAAAKIADAATDPSYVACMSAAGAGDVVTIGFMAAVTAMYATGVLGDMQNPEECVAAIKNEAMGAIASLLNEMLTSGGLAQSLLDAVLPDLAVDLIKTIAADAIGDAAKFAVDALWDALGIVTSKLECGCAAAGTAAIIKGAYDDMKATLAGIGTDAASCVDILQDPFGFLESALSNPGKTLQVIGDAACEGAEKLGLDVCGAFVSAGGAVIGFFNDVAEAAWGGAKAVGCVVTLGVWGCDEESPPPGPPPLCSTNAAYANNLADACICPSGMGMKAFKLKTDSCGSDGKKFEDLNWAEQTSCKKDVTYTDKKYCAPCDQYSILNSFGVCQSCPAGLKPGKDGKCSEPIVCNKAAGQYIGVDGHTCETCPAGSKLGKNGKCNANPAVCSEFPWMVAKSGKNPPSGVTLGEEPQFSNVNTSGNGDATWCACPDGLVNDGQACVKPKKVNTKACTLEWQIRDPKTGICKDRCGPNYVYGPPQSGDVYTENVCNACPDGKIAYLNACVDRCEINEKRDVYFACTFCGANWKAGGKKNTKGEFTQCVPACGKGESFIGGKCVPACGDNQIRMEVNLAGGPPVPTCTACPAGTNPGGTLNGAGEPTACINECPSGSAFQKVEASIGGVSWGNLTGVGNTTIGVCVTCPAGTHAKTTKTTLYNATIESTVCAACPKSMTSSAGAEFCHAFSAGTVSLLPGGKLPPADRKVNAAPANRSLNPNAGDNTGRPVQTRTQAQPGRLECRPGMVPNRAGTRCIIDLDDADDGRSGGAPGSTVPVNRGRGPVGGGITNPTRN